MENPPTGVLAAGLAALLPEGPRRPQIGMLTVTSGPEKCGQLGSRRRRPVPPTANGSEGADRRINQPLNDSGTRKLQRKGKRHLPRGLPFKRCPTQKVKKSGRLRECHRIA